MDLSIIIVAYNVKELMQTCLSYLRQSKDTLSKEVIYVDNGSSDGSVEMVKREFPEVHVIESPINLGFIGANNLGYLSATGNQILLLNSDAFIRENTLQILVDFIQTTPDCGIVGCQAVAVDGTPLPSLRFFPTPWRIFLMKLGWDQKLPFIKAINPTYDVTQIQECDWVTGCCLLVRKSIVDDLGVLLRPELFMYNDDNDLCLRVKKKGWKVYFHPTEIVHLAGVNNEKIAKVESDRWRIVKLMLESEYIYMRKNYGLWAVWTHFFLIMFYDLLKGFKGIFKRNRSEIFRERMTDISLAWSILKQTKQGQQSLPR